MFSACHKVRPRSKEVRSSAIRIRIACGGGRGIRTPGGCYTTAVFKTAAINRTRPSLRRGPAAGGNLTGGRGGRGGGKQQGKEASGPPHPPPVVGGVGRKSARPTSRPPRRHSRPRPR